MKKAILLLLLLSLFTLSCGFSVHTKADLPFKEIYLRNIENLTLEPGLQDKVRKTLHQVLTERGFTVTSQADKILDLKIKNYRLITLSEIGLTTVEYEIQMELKALLYDGKGRKLKEFTISPPFKTVFRTTRELQRVIADKDLAMESLLRDISDEMIRKLIFSDDRDSKI